MTVLNVLLVEDNPDDAELLIRSLSRSGYTVQWERVETAESYRSRIQPDIDLILADYSLPQFNAVHALRILKELDIDIPFIVVTGTVTEDIVIECMKQGASDYLLKDRLTRLGSAVAQAMEQRLLRQAKRKADDALREHAASLELRVAERTQELQLAKEHVEAILNHTGDAIILTTPDGRIRKVNPAFEELFGYFESDILNIPLLSIVEPDSIDLLDAAFRNARDGTTSHRQEIRVRRQNGESFTAEIVVAPMGEQVESAGIVCSIWDVTELKRTEETLRRALEQEKDLNDLKSQFTSMLSHEFRTPLAVIQSSSDLLMNYSERMTPEKRVRQIENIQLQVKRLTDLLNDILTIGKAQTVGLEFSPERLDIVALSRGIANEIIMTARQHMLEFTAEGIEFDIFADAKLLRQAITNLLSNAVKYSPEGTKIAFQVRGVGSQMIIQVQDEGYGIAEEDQERLFEVFFRAQNTETIPGTGLGLPIVKGAVEAHGGTVSVESTLGVGTTFTLTIPIMYADTDIYDE